MQVENRFLDDLARLANGALGVLSSAKSEIEALVRQQVQRLLGEAELVDREEFEAVRAMAQKAREEQEALAARVAALEAAIAEAGLKPPAAKAAKAKTKTRRTRTAGTAKPRAARSAAGPARSGSADGD